MKKILAIVILTVCSAFSVQAEEQQVLQLFASTLHDGKTGDEQTRQ